MKTFNRKLNLRAILRGSLAAVLSAGLFTVMGAGSTTAARAGDDAGKTQVASESQSDTAVVVPYKSRPAPSHRVTLVDDRVFFLTSLEQRGEVFVLHTLEDEVIEVEASDITEIVEFKSR